MLFINMRIILVSLQLKIKATNSSVSFQTVTKESTTKLQTLIKKAAQSMDIPTKLVKELGCLFSGFIASDVNKYIN